MFSKIVPYKFQNLQELVAFTPRSHTICCLIILSLASTVVLAYHGYGGDGDHGHAHYKFEYGVHDPHTHDIKSHHEHRNGDHVTGAYSLKEADGTTRVVKYKSGPHSGFEAVVERIGHAGHPSHYGHHGYGGDAGFGGASSWVAPIHWANQGHDNHHGFY